MKKILVTTIFVILSFLMVACEKKENQDATTNEKGMVYIYYPENNGVVKSEEKYQIKQPDSVSYSVEELMLCIMGELDERMEYHTYLIDADNNVTLWFVCNGEYNREYMLLSKAAVVETLFQIESINSVSIKVSDEIGNIIGDNFYLRDSFYFYDYDNDMNVVKAVLYYPDDAGFRLVRQNKNIIIEPNITVEEKIINELVELGALPSMTRVNSISIRGDVCYIDFNEAFNEEVKGVKSEVVIYAIVNSLISSSDIKKVKITINGEEVEKYRHSVDISNPLQFNNELLN